MSELHAAFGPLQWAPVSTATTLPTSIQVGQATPEAAWGKEGLDHSRLSGLSSRTGDAEVVHAHVTCNESLAGMSIRPS